MNNNNNNDVMCIERIEEKKTASDRRERGKRVKKKIKNQLELMRVRPAVGKGPLASRHLVVIFYLTADRGSTYLYVAIPRVPTALDVHAYNYTRCVSLCLPHRPIVVHFIIVLFIRLVHSIN